jgi:hypothetical protein
MEELRGLRQRLLAYNGALTSYIAHIDRSVYVASDADIAAVRQQTISFQQTFSTLEAEAAAQMATSDTPDLNATHAAATLKASELSAIRVLHCFYTTDPAAQRLFRSLDDVAEAFLHQLHHSLPEDTPSLR